MEELKDAKLGFIGGGNIATSLITGLLKSGLSQNNISVSDPNSEKRQHLASLGIKTTDSDNEVAANVDILILAMKPKDVQSAITELKKSLRESTLIISIVAGIRTTTLERWLSHPMAIVRAMPNTPALLRAGATALYANTRVSEDQRNLAESILRSVGVTAWVNHEHDIDTVTAVSGSGPAYFFVLMEALLEAAESLGMSESTAKLLTLQTALGAARMALESEISIKDLINRVASKGGTTESALSVLDKAKFTDIIKQAVKGAHDRSIEISQHFDSP